MQLKSPGADVLMWQKAIARMDRYGRREVVDNDWLTREVFYTCLIFSFLYFQLLCILCLCVWWYWRYCV